ncbi:MAG: glycosyltransferase family 4 protein [Candidatus Omnitrophica bacterium]|nr:glycosyltransferase family 4 protein [Candidatus Omnitrophota bacterium]
MKICYIFSNFHLLHITGQPDIVFKLVSQAHKRGEEVYLISNAPEQEQLYQGGINLFLIRGLGDFKTYFLNIFKIIKYLRDVKPDIIHVHGYLLTIFVWIINRFFHIPLVCSVCETLDILNSFYKNLIIFCFNHSELTFVTSECIKNHLIENGVSTDKIVIARIGLDGKFLKGGEKFLPATDILYYGDAMRGRGFDFIIRLAQNLPKFNFKILIRWRDKNYDIELEKLKKLSNVAIYYYPHYPEDLKSIILKSKLVILPYRWMGVRPPLSLVESMALGRCVITSAMKGNEEIIKNWHNGIIVDFNKLDEVISNIHYLLSDEQKRKYIETQAKETIKAIYSHKEYDMIFQFYNKILTYSNRNG